MRYGNQPMSDIEKMDMGDIAMWADEIVELIKAENATGSRNEED